MMSDEAGAMGTVPGMGESMDVEMEAQPSAVVSVNGDEDVTVETVSMTTEELEAQFQMENYRNALIAWNLVLFYFLTGIGFYTAIEGWNVDESLYFAITTLTTVGYGDLHPKTPGGKVFTMFFIGIALTIIVIFISVLISYHMERVEEHVLNRSDGKNDYDPLQKKEEQCCSCADPESPAGFTIDSYKKGMLWSGLYLVIMIIFGTITFMVLEKGQELGFLDAMYMSVVTMSSVGLGDIHPKSDAGRLIAIPFILISVMVVGNAMGEVGAYVLNERQRRRDAIFMSRRVSMEDLLKHAGEDEEVMILFLTLTLHMTFPMFT